MGILLRVRRCWRPVRLFYRFALPARFTIIVLALVSYAFILAAQGQDLLRVLAEPDADGTTHWGRTLVFLAVVALLAAMAWYWTRQLLAMRRPGEPPARLFPLTATWLPRILGVMAFLAMMIGTLRARTGYKAELNSPRRALAIIAAVMGICAIVFLAIVVARRKWLTKTGAAHPVMQAGVQRFTIGMLLLLAALDGLFLIASAAVPLRLTGLGSGTIVVLSAALWIAGGGLLVWFGLRTRFPVLTLLLVFAVVFSCYNDNHAVRKLDTAGAPVRPELAAYVQARYEALLRGNPARTNGRIPVFVVATEGGGVRAAYWTAAVLTHLQDSIAHKGTPSFADHCFAISGISGGSVGALVFDALRAEEIDALSNGKEFKLRPSAKAILGERSDALAPTLAVLLKADFLQRFLPFRLFHDRAQALETAWESSWRHDRGNERFSSSFVKLFEKYGMQMPAVMMNGTMVEGGNRIITSNVHIGAEFSDSRDAFEVLGSFDDPRKLARSADLRLSTAALMSARFTYVSPAGTLRNADDTVVGHVVDGGYFENSGAATGAELVRYLQQTNLPIDVWVIVIKFGYDSSGLPTPERVANEALSPVRALLNTRDARGELAVVDIRKFAPSRVVTFRLLRDGVPIPLGWVLSGRSQRAIDLSIDSPKNKEATNLVSQLIAPVQPVLPDKVTEVARAAEATERAAEKEH
jgi:hypothetical protein